MEFMIPLGSSSFPSRPGPHVDFYTVFAFLLFGLLLNCPFVVLVVKYLLTRNITVACCTPIRTMLSRLQKYCHVNSFSISLRCCQCANRKISVLSSSSNATSYFLRCPPPSAPREVPTPLVFVGASKWCKSSITGCVLVPSYAYLM
jgi:hypothetical protein